VITLATALLAGVALHAAPVAAQRDYDQPPAGLAADQQLWRDLRASANDAVTGLGRIAQCSFRIDYGGYYQRLELAATNPSARPQALSLRETLSAAAAAADASQLPPPRDPSVRECRAVLVDLDTMMPLHGDPKIAGRLAEARAQARRCVETVRPFADRAEARAAALEAALGAVDRFAPGPPPPAAATPASTGEGAARPAPAVKP
jgi:hypothetical protein